MQLFTFSAFLFLKLRASHGQDSFADCFTV